MEQLDENALNIYTDGSSYSGPRRGGIGIRFVSVDDDGNPVVQDWEEPGYAGATNQQMEIKACIEALRIAASRNLPVDPSRYRKIVIRSDSMYLVENFSNAKFRWPQNKWLTKDGAPVLNADLWKELLRGVKHVGKRVDVEWVKGHRKSPHNKAADKLAKQSAKQASHQGLSITRIRRKTSPRSVERGSVQMQGQRATIRIITDEYLRVQRCYKYKYEVLSKRRPYYQYVDIIFSDIMLSAGHTYRVRFNDDTKNPRIEKMFVEIV